MGRKYKHNIVREKGEAKSVTVFHKGEDHVATTAHPNFDKIIAAVENDEPIGHVLELFDTYRSIGSRLKGAMKRLFTKTPSGLPPSPDRPSERGRRELMRRIGEKVEVRRHAVYYDGKQMHGTLADTIARYYMEGNEDWEPLALFLDKVMRNPNDHSREQLYDWLDHFSFQITPDGNFLAYKYLTKDMKSSHAGVGIVNGVRTRGHLDNSIGNVVEMPRKMVTHDPTRGCASGLHVGTWNFVKGHPTIVRVEIDPRDVVSVPTESDWQKLRVCKYKVLEIAKAPDDSKIYAGSVAA